MSRFTYSTSTPIGQIVAEAVNSAQESRYKLNRAVNAVEGMNDEQAKEELGVDNLAGFRNALNQLNAAYEKEPFKDLLPVLDQG
ncbi:hypothetical protein NX722_05565 [Endozoicomonas gorgoniicola]|uniref:Uncharacterized protein n=1 Tax=Endozoicomonas gorgoniicola TaxID=1234144 RepID=A0ABT3MRX3_9GAMM|nr:hypothetical protein [Endozoicomonas gorgoniicola]MCW7552120.1 hypothetical protein [Endozoicomonas gorgoniicola]